MKAVILCDTINNGLVPVNERTPDSMLRLVGQTAAGLAVKAVLRAEISDITALGGCPSEPMISYFETADFGGATPRFVQREGTLSAQLFTLCGGEDLLVIDACTVSDSLPERLVRFYLENGGQLAIAAAERNENVSGCKLKQEKGILTKFARDEFSADGDFNAVFCKAAVFSADILSAVADREIFTFEEIIAFVLSDGERTAVMHAENVMTLHSPAAYLNTSLSLLASGKVPDNAVLRKGVYSEKEIAMSGITLISPIYIGKNVTLEKGCLLKNCVIGDNSVVGARARLENCVVVESVHIGAGVQAESAVVCTGATIGSAARLDSGSVVGEETVVGSGSRIMSGVSVSGKSRIYTGEIVADSLSGHRLRSVMIDDECRCVSGADVFTPCDCAAFAMAFGTALTKGMTAVCGCSDTVGAKGLLAAFESGLLSAGINVFSVGHASEQEIMFLLSRLGGNVGVSVGADFSGEIRLMSRGGLPLGGDVKAAAERAFSLRRYRTETFENYGERQDMSGAKPLYRRFLSEILPDVMHGVNADVRCTDTAAAECADRLVRPRNDTDGERTVFHISGDGRSCTAYTDGTGYVSGERLVLLAVKAAFEKNLPVSLPYTFPIAADTVAEQMGGKLYRYFFNPTDFSDTAARETAMRPDNFFVRDGMVLMCTVCAYLSEKRLTLGKALSDIPQFYSAQRFTAADATASEIYRLLGCKNECGGEGVAVQSGSSRAIVRPLRHRQGLIIFTESVSSETACELCDDIILKLKNGG